MTQRSCYSTAAHIWLLFRHHLHMLRSVVQKRCTEICHALRRDYRNTGHKQQMGPKWHRSSVVDYFEETGKQLIKLFALNGVPIKEVAKQWAGCKDAPAPADVDGAERHHGEVQQQVLTLASLSCTSIPIVQLSACQGVRCAREGSAVSTMQVNVYTGEVHVPWILMVHHDQCSCGCVTLTIHYAGAWSWR